MWGKIEVGYRMYEANYVKSRNKVKIQQAQDSEWVSSFSNNPDFSDVWEYSQYPYLSEYSEYYQKTIQANSIIPSIPTPRLFPLYARSIPIKSPQYSQNFCVSVSSHNSVDFVGYPLRRRIPQNFHGRPASTISDNPSHRALQPPEWTNVLPRQFGRGGRLASLRIPIEWTWSA